MNRRKFLASAFAVTILPRGGAAQGPAKLARIGWLTAQQPASLAPSFEVLRAALADFGYVQGRNLTIEYRYGNDDIERVPALAAELIRSSVELILAQGAAVSVLNKLKLPVPVVFASSGDPVSAGFSNSLARPSGNLTGVTFMAADLNGKRLELLQDMLPGLRRVAIIANPEHPGEHLERDYSERVGRKLGMDIEYFPTRTSEELTAAFAKMAANPPPALSLFADGFAIQNRARIIDFGMSHGAPLISGWPAFAKSGAICTYGPRLLESYRRMAYYVDRILNGAKPADLPIEQPTKFELIVNLRTAKALGITMPPSILVRADDVIE